MFPWNLFPFNLDSKKMMQQMKPEEINSYIQNMMGQMFPEHLQKMMNEQNLKHSFTNKAKQSSQSTSLPSSVFETHDFVYVRVQIKNEEWLKAMRLYYTSNQMIIEHIPEYDDKHTIILPALVKKKGTTAQVKDNILEIKIPKSVDMQYSEIDITKM